LKAIKHCACKKILLQYIVCAGKLGSMSCCLVGQQSRLIVMLVISITGLLVPRQISNPIPLYGFWLWLVCESIITLTNQECIHQQDDYACWLLSSPAIVAIILMAAISLHCCVDVTLSQSKAQCLLTSFRQTAQVNFILLTLSARESAACW
jgi:hypothetical protein